MPEFGGPFYNDAGAGENAAQRAFGGTFLLLEAESHEEALKIIQADEYYKEGLVRAAVRWLPVLMCFRAQWEVAHIRLVEYNPLSGYPF